MDIARRVSGYVALGNGEGRVDSRSSKGRVLPHMGHHIDHKKVVEDHKKVVGAVSPWRGELSGVGLITN